MLHHLPPRMGWAQVRQRYQLGKGCGALAEVPQGQGYAHVAQNLEGKGGGEMAQAPHVEGQ